MCFACIAATRAGSPACYNDIQEAAAERALAFAHRVTAKTIPIRLVDYGNVVTDTRETELADIVKRTFKAVAPDGSDVEVTWHSENKKADSDVCTASYLYPESVSGSYSMAIHAADFNSANCKYPFAGVAELNGDQGATLEDPANDKFQHLLVHEIGHMLGANHATLYSEEYGDPTGALGSRISIGGDNFHSRLHWLTCCSRMADVTRPRNRIIKFPNSAQQIRPFVLPRD